MDISWILITVALTLLGIGILIAVFVKVYNKVTCGKCHNYSSMRNKTVIVTGGNRGIGKEIALALALREAKVIIACRDLISGKQAADDIIYRTGNRSVVVRHLDLSSLESIRLFANDISKLESRLDVLIHNAGIIASNVKTLTADKLELTMATNYIGPYLLTNLLLDLMKKSAPAKIINFSSNAHSFGTIDLTNLNSEKNYFSWLTYSNSKLAVMLYTKELAERLQGTGITTFVNHPGFVNTDLFRHLNPLIRWFVIFNVWLFFKTPREGAQTAIYLAMLEEIEELSGNYFVDCKVKKEHLKGRDMTTAKQLWTHTEKLLASHLC